MMHPLSSGGYQPYGMEGGGGQQSPPDQQVGSPHDPSSNGAPDHQNGGGGAVGAPHYSDINQILDQILNITDQSLDEAQVRAVKFISIRKNKQRTYLSSEL